MSANQELPFNLKKSFKISALFALFICILITIFKMTGKSSDDYTLFFIIGIPLYFVIAFLICFVFLILKFHKKLIYFFFALAFLIGKFGFSSEGDYFIKNLLLSKSVPEEYKNFHSLDTNKPFTFGNRIVKLFLKSDFYTDKFMNTKNNTIVVTYKQSEINTSDRTEATQNFFKLNKNGDIISKYSTTPTQADKEIVVGDFLINPTKGYFKSWILDNDTIRKPFLVENANLKWDKTKEIQLIEKIKNEATLYYKTYHYPDDTSKVVVIYFLDGKWRQFYTDLEDANGINKNFETLEVSYFEKNTANVLPLYLIKKEYESYDVANGAMQPGSHRENTLETEFYCMLPLNQDTLKFKMDETLFEDNKSDQLFWTMKGENVRKYRKQFKELIWQYNFFTDKHNDYVFFESSSYNMTMEFNLYIIKHKK